MQQPYAWVGNVTLARSTSVPVWLYDIEWILWKIIEIWNEIYYTSHINIKRESVKCKPFIKSRITSTCLRLLIQTNEKKSEENRWVNSVN